MQHTVLHGPVPALLAESYVGVPPFRSVEDSCRHLPGGQARKTALKAVQRTGAADVQASKQPSLSTVQPTGVLEKGTFAQQCLPDAPERLSSSALLRRLTAMSTANEALDIFLQDGAARQSSDTLQRFTEASVCALQDHDAEILTYCWTYICPIQGYLPLHITLCLAAFPNDGQTTNLMPSSAL